MKILIFIGLGVVLIGNCRNRQFNTSLDELNDTITFKTQLIESDSSIPYYQCDDYFAYNIQLSTKNVDSIYPAFFKCSKEPIINIYDSTIIDTICTFSKGDNMIKIYKSYYSGDLLMLFDVADTIFKLNSNIRIGMSKDRFIKKFGLTGLKNDTIEIGNMEHTDAFRFYFKNNLLRRIRNEPYLD